MAQSAKDVTFDSEFIKCLLVGPPGTGKSIFASTFPTKGYVYDFSFGIQSYRGKDFDYDQFSMSTKGWAEFEKAHTEVKKAVAEGKYQSVIVDDTTGMTSLAMERSLSLDPKRSASNGPLWNVHYQLVRNLMEGKLRQIIDLNCNVVIISHLDYITDKETGVILGTQPMLTGQLPTVITGYFDEVYYTSTRRKDGNTEWVMQTIPIGFNAARSRLSGVEGYLPQFIPNNYNTLIETIKKGVEDHDKKNTSNTPGK